MGAQTSLISADRQEKAEEIEKSMITRFRNEYLAEYRAQHIAALNSEMEATDGLLAGSVNQLKSRPVSAAEAPRPPLYSGWLTKLGAVRKSWKRRWFVVSPDYGMAYYAGSDTRGAPKGEMMLQGYEVRADCFKAEKDLCIELYHQKRRCFYVYANTVEEYEQWIPILKEVCRKARYQIHADPLRARAFAVAFEATQKMMEVASERLPEISEADALTDLVCDMIYDVVLSDTFIDDPNGFGNHSFASKTVLRKRLEMRVGAEVATALQDINEQAEHFRRRVMPDLKEAWPEFVRVEVDLNERIEKVILPVVQPALNRIVKPSNRRILSVIIPIIADAYRDVLSKFYDASLQAIETIARNGMQSAAETLSELSRSVAGGVRYREHPLNSIVAKVERLNSLFDEGVTETLEQDGIVVYPDAVVDKVLEALQTVMDQAVYVFDDEINAYRNSTTDFQPAITDLRKLHQRSVNALHHDSHASMATLIGTVAKGMVLPPYLEHVGTPAQEVSARSIPLDRVIGDQAAPGDMTKSRGPVSIIHQALDVKKMTQSKIVSLAAEPIQVVAVGACASLLIGSRGGGDCPICQAKMQASAEEEDRLEEPVVDAQHDRHAAAQQPMRRTNRAPEREHPPHFHMGDDGEDSDDSYAAWGWENEEPQPAVLTLMGADSATDAAGVAVGASAVVGTAGRTEGMATQERHLGQHGAGRAGSQTGAAASGSVGSLLPGPGNPVAGGGPRRPRSSPHHSSGVATGGVAVGVGAGPSIQAMSAQWRQGLSLQRPAREPGRKTPVAAGRTKGLGHGQSGPTVRGAARGASPTRSRNSDGERSSRSGDS